MASASYPLPHPVRPIGTPYQGTHAKAFNKKGGSDNWESENAVDLPTPKGTPIYAVAAGTIGKQIGAQGGGRFAGLRVHLISQGNEFFYAHLSRLVVKAGEKVADGQLIGYSGVANGVAHLHFAAKVGDPRDVFGNATGNHTAPQPTDQTSAPTTDAIANATAPSIAAPAVAAPPTALATPSPDVQLPGSVDYTLNAHQQAIGLWSQVAQSDFVSPDTAQMLANAQLAGGSLASS